MPAQIRFPIIQRRVLEHLVGGFEKFGLLHVHTGGLEDIDVLEITAPIPIGRQLLKLAHRHLVVVLLRIAQLHACARGLGKLRLER